MKMKKDATGDLRQRMIEEMQVSGGLAEWPGPIRLGWGTMWAGGSLA